MENLLPLFVGQIINTCSNATEARLLMQWAAPSCSRPQPAADNGDRDDRLFLCKLFLMPSKSK